jgi:hypothetical protein
MTAHSAISEEQSIMNRPVGLVSRSYWRGTTALQPTLEGGTALGILLAVLLLTLIGWLYLDQAATITSTRAEIKMLEKERDAVLLEIRYLQADLASRTSTGNAVERGRQLGFHAPEQIVTLDVVPLPMPTDHGVAAPSLVPASRDALPGEDVPWWYSALCWLEHTFTAGANVD